MVAGHGNSRTLPAKVANDDTLGNVGGNLRRAPSSYDHAGNLGNLGNKYNKNSYLLLAIFMAMFVAILGDGNLRKSTKAANTANPSQSLQKLQH